MLTQHDFESWAVGAPAVLIGANLGAAFPRGRTEGGSLLGWVRFLGYFCRASWQGGWDVARRVLTPSLPVFPTLVEYRLRLSSGPARWFFVHVINLLPGTVSVHLRDDMLAVHVIQQERDHQKELSRVEKLVASAFGCSLVSQAFSQSV